MKKIFWLFFFLSTTIFAFDEQVTEKLLKTNVGNYLSFEFMPRPLEGPWVKIGKDWIPPPPKLSRGISNYRRVEIRPFNHHLYQVIEILNHVPTPKGKRWELLMSIDKNGMPKTDLVCINEDKFKRKKALVLKRIHPPQDDKDDGIFWFINAENAQIQQHEDGDWLSTITQINIWDQLPTKF